MLHGNRTYLLQDDNGQITETHSISAGLDYPGVGPEHAYLKDIGRAEYVGITDDEALAAFHRLCRTEGIIPALESSHAVAYAMKLAPTMRADQHLLVNLSGRGDKDIGTVADLSGAEFYCRPSCRGQTREGRCRMSRIAATFAALQAQRPQGADPLRHRRRPVRRRDRRHHAGDGRGRRRRDRTRRAVLRPDGRRPGDPEGLRARAGQGHRHDAGAGDRARASARATTRTPVVLMGYANPIERYGVGRASSPTRSDAGVDGVLVVDYPPEECEAFAAQLRGARARPDLPARADLDRRSASREVGRIASGYVYYVSLKGVTGAGHLDTAAVARDGAAHPRAREAAGRRGLRHPRRATARAVADGGRRGRDRLGARAAARDARAARNVAAAAADFIGGIRAALDS